MRERVKSQLPANGLNLESLMEALLYRDEFLSLAGHELKTPLTALKLQTQVFKRAANKHQGDFYTREKVDRLVDHIDNHTNHMVRLIDQMLDVCRIRSGQLTIVEESFDLSGKVSEMAQIFEVSEVNIAKGVSFYGDEKRLGQVVGHLLDNARKYGMNRGIKIKLTQTKKKIVLSVKDEGPGISQKKQKEIFHCFGRGVAASEISGIGLGLYLSREIVEAHGGKISVKSISGKGAAFTVELPLQKSFSF